MSANNPRVHTKKYALTMRDCVSVWRMAWAFLNTLDIFIWVELVKYSPRSGCRLVGNHERVCC